MKNEALTQLQRILGKNAGVEVFERVVKLLENSTFSALSNCLGLQRNDFESSTLMLLERLETALRQMKVLSGKERFRSGSEDLSWAKYLNLARDLLKTNIITPLEFQEALKKPEHSSLPRLLRSLKREARNLFSLLVIGYAEKPKKPVEQCDVEELLALAAGRHVA
ncbi:MAG: hypothetical protein LBC64_03325 [Fibromonadaceae bacterium]|jgi:hypothetical protein|nr:hypothetical protein [Fibromonadaceae bacterium]